MIRPKIGRISPCSCPTLSTKLASISPRSEPFLSTSPMTTRHLFTAALGILGTFATALAADPVVLNLTPAQRPGTQSANTTRDVTAPDFELTNAP